jgi:hypothetical protein
LEGQFAHRAGPQDPAPLNRSDYSGRDVPRRGVRSKAQTRGPRVPARRVGFPVFQWGTRPSPPCPPSLVESFCNLHNPSAVSLWWLVGAAAVSAAECGGRKWKEEGWEQARNILGTCLKHAWYYRTAVGLLWCHRFPAGFLMAWELLREREASPRLPPARPGRAGRASPREPLRMVPRL